MVLFKITLNWIKKCFLELSVVVHAYSFNTGQDEARDQQFEAILNSVIKIITFISKKFFLCTRGISHLNIATLTVILVREEQDIFLLAEGSFGQQIKTRALIFHLP